MQISVQAKLIQLAMQQHFMQTSALSPPHVELHLRHGPSCDAASGPSLQPAWTKRYAAAAAARMRLLQAGAASLCCCGSGARTLASRLPARPARTQPHKCWASRPSMALAAGRAAFPEPHGERGAAAGPRRRVRRSAQ